MRSIESTAYQLVEKIKPNLPNLRLADSVYTTPYIGKPLVNSKDNIVSEEEQMFSFEDIAFVNTKEFSKSGDYFLKNGVYTTASPIFDREDHKQFWDIEEDRRKNGMTLPGKLYNDNGIWKVQKVHITGEHYGYLNYGEIKRSADFEVKQGVLVSPYGEKLSLEDTSRRGTIKKERSLPAFWDGDYYFFKAVELCKKIGRHLVVGKARRKGYSYKNGFLVANEADLYKYSTSVVGAYDEDTLTDDGIMTKVQMYLDFICKHTDWNKRRLHNTLRHIEIGYRFVGDAVKRGHLSNIYTAVLQKDPGGLRGKDANLILIEEAGKMANLADVLAPTLKTLEDGRYMTGLMIVFGTGGGDEKYWQAFEDLIYNTYEHKFATFENIWDKELEGTGCGFFHSAYMSKPGMIDEFGNSDVKGAVEYEKKERLKLKNNPTKLNNYIMEEPFNPSEAFSRVSNSIMPTTDLDIQLKKLLHDPDYANIHRDGIFVREPEGIKFYNRALMGRENFKDIPPAVTDYPTKKTTDVRGCWRLWEMPYRDPKTGKIPDNLYHAWNDPFGIDKKAEEFNMDESLGCCWIYESANTFTHTRGDRVVAEYIGRPEEMETFDSNMFLGMEFFNAMLLYENDRGEVYSNAKKMGMLDRLKDEPEFMYQKDLQAGGKGRKKGISIATNQQRKINGAVYFANWLKQTRGTDNSGRVLLNLHYFYSIKGIRECLKYDGKKNADCVSTGIIGMYDTREMMHKNIVPEQSQFSIINDPYFL